MNQNFDDEANLMFQKENDSMCLFNKKFSDQSIGIFLDYNNKNNQSPEAYSESGPVSLGHTPE